MQLYHSKLKFQILVLTIYITPATTKCNVQTFYILPTHSVCICFVKISEQQLLPYATLHVWFQ